MGGLIGGIVGGIAGENMAELAHWFFGGRSRLSAEEILGPDLLFVASIAVYKRLSASDRHFHIHQVLSTHTLNAHVVEEMISTKSMERVEVEVQITLHKRS